MMEVGHQGSAQGLGKYQVQKLVKLKEPVEYCDDKGKRFFFHPLLAQIKWKNTGDLELWLTYYIQKEGEKPRFAGQFSPMVSEDSFVELLVGAIEEGFFSPRSLSTLQQAISKRSGEVKDK